MGLYEFSNGKVIPFGNYGRAVKYAYANRTAILSVWFDRSFDSKVL